ncbi:lipoyl domain-containing protein [Paenarthrobacter sp. Z7-10]|nr:lipoyl domain-containing protein [Paenarthrobacter sp. Z7-10]
MTDAQIVSWKVMEGGVVAFDDVLVEVETATSRLALPAPFAGVVARILVQEGQRAAVGTPILVIGRQVVPAQGLAHQSIPEDAAGRLVPVKGFPKTVPMEEPPAADPASPIHLQLPPQGTSTAALTRG